MSVLSNLRATEKTRLTALGAWLCLTVYGILLSVGVFTAGIWAIGGIGLALTLYAIAWHDAGAMPRPNKSLVVLTGAFLIGAGWLNLRSVDTDISWWHWLTMLTIFVPLLLLSCRSVYSAVFVPAFTPC